MLNVPTGSDEVVNFARCVVGLTVPVPSTVVPFLKVTVPLGEPERTAFTVAVNVTGLPCVDGLALEARVVVVFDLIVNVACLVVSVLPACTLWFAKLLARLVPRPDLYILLDVPAEVLQQRKPEVTCEESRRQRHAYLQMFQSMPNAFVVDAACSLDDVTQQMKAVILETMANRTPDRNEVSLTAPASLEI